MTPDTPAGAGKDVCTLCGGSEVVRPYLCRLPWLAKCGGCGLGFVDPQPDANELDEVYGEDYFRRFGCDGEGEGAYRAIKQATHNELLRRVEQTIRVGRLLDVGSAVGDMLAVARRRGWEARGVEPIAYACETADRVAPGASFCGPLEAFDANEGPFDLVACTETLEHLGRPDQALAMMGSLLRPGGLLALTVPNASCLAARVQGPRWWHYHRDHLWYFDRRTLPALVRKAGFDIVECGRARKVFNLWYVLGVLANTPQAPWLAREARWGLASLPRRLLAAPWPAVCEGLFVLARWPLAKEREGESAGRPRPLRAQYASLGGSLR